MLQSMGSQRAGHDSVTELTESMMKEAKLYSGERTISSINVVGKTGHAKESNYPILKNKLKMC